MNKEYNLQLLNKLSVKKIYNKCKTAIVDFSNAEEHSTKSVLVATLLFMVSAFMLIGLLFLTVDTTSIKPIVETHQIGCI